MLFSFALFWSPPTPGGNIMAKCSTYINVNNEQFQTTLHSILFHLVSFLKTCCLHYPSPGLGEKSGPGVTVRPAHSIHGALPTQCIARIDPVGPPGINPVSLMASPPLHYPQCNLTVDSTAGALVALHLQLRCWAFSPNLYSFPNL